jgi:integrase
VAAATAQLFEFPVPQRQQRSQPPRRRANKDARAREWLEPHEVKSMVAAIRRRDGRMVERDVLMILLAYHRGLRATELCELRWDQIEFKPERIHVRRLKNGIDGAHPLYGDELRAIRAWQRAQGEGKTYVFTSLSGTPITRRAFHYVVNDVGKEAGISFALSSVYASPCLRCQANRRGSFIARHSGLSRSSQHRDDARVYPLEPAAVRRMVLGSRQSEQRAAETHCQCVPRGCDRRAGRIRHRARARASMGVAGSRLCFCNRL